MREYADANSHSSEPVGVINEAHWDALIARGEEFEARREGTTEQPLIGLEFPADIEIEARCDDLVKHIIAPGTLVAIYGPSGVGKTFVALMAAFRVALGLDVGGRRTRCAPVLYVALEGQVGVRKRIRAAVDQYGDPGRFFARMIAPGILNKTDAGEAGVRAVVAHAKALTEEAGETVGLIIVDTLARAMAGDDENSAQDMGFFVEQRAAEIIRQTGAAVLVVHHTGKDAARGMRGSNSLFGAADAVIRIDESKTVELEKVKDGADGTWFAYELRPVTLGTDDDGDPITSCVVDILQGVTASKTAAKPKTLPPQSRAALAVLRDIYIDGKARHVPKSSINGVEVPRCVRLSDWRAACRAKGLTAAEDEPTRKADAEKKAFGRARDAIEAAGIIGSFGEHCWLTDQAGTASVDVAS